ncbi:MAG: phosphatase PAP2 family protein [Acidimicrobiia bacterium]|nr:phosphatase PAP2 family protein [Acidimicrobiia bacterium]
MTLPLPHLMFERRIHALIAGLALLVVGASLAVMVAVTGSRSVVQAVDDRWLEWMGAIRTPWIIRTAKTLSVVGSPLVIVPLRLFVIVMLAVRRRWLQLGAFIAATICSELCIGPLKALIDRPRPPGGLIETSSSSFPSGHAVAASATAIGLMIVLVPAAGRRAHWTVIASTFAIVMAMSRTNLSVHWASDVIAGGCLGTGFAVVWPAALELERERRRVATAQQATTSRDLATR